MKANIFNIQRYSIHDGSGIRTIIFFKGCPLRCPWCSNPESQKKEAEIMKNNSLCIQCSAENAYDCEESPEICPTNALTKVGKEMTIDELKEEVLKDIVFYDASGGGVTLSGGEALLYADFNIELLKELKKLGIHTALETSGHGDPQKLLKMASYIDEILFDLKIIDNNEFKTIIGGDIELIKNNFESLLKNDFNVIPRIALIPGFTANSDNIYAIIKFLKSNNIKEVHLLPFHQYGSSKYQALGREYQLEHLPLLQEKEIAAIVDIFEKHEFDVILGG